jgi:hypothetical protein
VRPLLVTDLFVVFVLAALKGKWRAAAGPEGGAGCVNCYYVVCLMYFCDCCHGCCRQVAGGSRPRGRRRSCQLVPDRGALRVE